jgi:biotin transport system substrate-specific component
MKLSIRTICFVGMFAAIISVLSILQIPTPWGVPFTLQTFAIALCGFVLGKKYGTIATAVYVILGAVGVPVFAGMSAGFGVLFGPTGGYIYGFILMALFCGLAYDFYEKKTSTGYLLAVLFSLIGLACCHVLGVTQFKFFSGLTWVAAALKATVPYLVKDILSVIVAFALAVAVRKALSAAGLLNWKKAAA